MVAQPILGIRPFVEPPVFHHGDEFLLFLKDRDILRRIAIHDQKVGEKSCLYGPDVLAHAHDLRS